MADLVKIREEGLLRRSSQDDASTYGTFFELFKKSLKQDLFKINLGSTVQIWRSFELAKIAPDVCPILAHPLDYGRGRNKVTNQHR